MLSVLIERRTDETDSKIVFAPADLSFAELRDWVLDNHRGYRFVESWPTPVAA